MEEYYIYAFKTEKEGMINCLGFYVKIHKDEIYYIGKGKGNRAYSTNQRNSEMLLFKKIFGCKINILKNNLTEKEAYLYEKALINYCQEKGILLTNKHLNSIWQLEKTLEMKKDKRKFENLSPVEESIKYFISRFYEVLT